MSVARRRPRPKRSAGLDPADFVSVYQHTYEDVLRWIRALGGPPGDQDDLVQEVFSIVYRKLPEFDGVNLAAWLYRITANRVRDFRTLSWFRNVVADTPLSLEKLESADPTPVVVLETLEKRRELERLLSRLSSRLRATFVLFELEGYTAEEIAQLQSVSVNAVRARIQRARKRLLKSLAAARRA